MCDQLANKFVKIQNEEKKKFIHIERCRATKVKTRKGKDIMLQIPCRTPSINFRF